LRKCGTQVMAETDPQLVNERKRINRKKKQLNDQFVRIVVWMFAFFATTFLLGFANQISQLTNVSLEIISIILRVSASVFLIGFFLILLNTFVRKRFEISDEDLLFLTVYKTLDKIEAYILDPNEVYRKDTENSIDKLMYNIELWNAGSLKVCQMEMNPHIVPFKEAFYKKIVGTVRKGEKDDWNQAFAILRMFAKFLVNPVPRIEELDFITTLMNKGIVVTLPIKKKENISLNYLMKIPTFKHALWIVLFIVVGVVLAYVGYSLNVPIEYDYGEAIGVPLALITVYFAYIKKQP
jgi:hypothetical protein